MIQVEQWPTDRPIPYARNPRKISPQAVSAVAGSIKEFGFKSPIIVDSAGVIINGHTRLKAAQSLGLLTVPVVVAGDLTPAQVQAYRLADNRVAEFSEWDADLLKIELAECPLDLTFAGFDELLKELPETDADAGDDDNPYTTKVETPVYKPTGECPPLTALCDESHANTLCQEIAKAEMSDTLRNFLTVAACRHYRFNYKEIAEYYAHAPANIQKLMEDSALVIVDFNRAIELGFVKLSDETAAAYTEEHGNE